MEMDNPESPSNGQFTSVNTHQLCRGNCTGLMRETHWYQALFSFSFKNGLNDFRVGFHFAVLGGFGAFDLGWFPISLVTVSMSICYRICRSRIKMK